jgi:hypothetical protein
MRALVDSIGRMAGLLLSAACLLAPAAGAQTAVVENTTLNGKVLFGYQGWFGCPGSWGGNWSHWGNPPGGVQVDMYPDLTDFPKADLCAVNGYGPGGASAYFFSARNPNVTDMHFKWMQHYGLDGVLIQRFLADIPGLKSQGDVVLKNILASSAKYGRVVAIEYDVTGSNFTNWARDMEADWKYLVDQLHVTAAPNYLHHKGRPLVSVWGVGLNENRNPPTNPADAIAMVNWFHTGGGAAAYAASVMGGVPAGFRTLSRDSRTDAGWLNAWKAFDVVQPWNVGRYASVSGVKSDYSPRTSADQKWLADAGVNYMTVMFPGYSFYNANHSKPQNEIKRMGGNFLWQQMVGAKTAKVDAIKIAMFDEVNEGTAMFKVVSKRSEAPPSGYWLALDGDGLDLPSDWYLRLASEMTRIQHGAQGMTDSIPIKPKDPFSPAGVEAGMRPASGPLLRWSRGAEGIRFSVSGPARSVVVNDLRGRLVRTLPVVDGAAFWDMADERRMPAVGGIYSARLDGIGGSGGQGLIAVP